MLETHPKVAEAAVMGIPDAMRGEIIGAIVNLNGAVSIGEQEIKRFCLDRMASYKVPKQVRFVNTLPRTEAGTVDKSKIRDLLSIPPVFKVAADN